MVRRGIFTISPSAKKNKESPSRNNNNNNNNSNNKQSNKGRQNLTSNVRPPDWKHHHQHSQHRWEDDKQEMVSDDSVPPAPPDQKSTDSKSRNSGKGWNKQQQQQPPMARVKVSTKANSPAHSTATWDPMTEIPKGSVQQNPFLAKNSSSSSKLDENNRPVMSQAQALSVTQERAKRLQAMESQMSGQQQQTPTPSKRGPRGFFGRSNSKSMSIANESPKSIYSAIDDKQGKKKKGLLKSFFGGGSKHSKHHKLQQQQQPPQPPQRVPSSPQPPSSPIVLEMESPATFTVGDVIDSPGRLSVNKMKERFETTSSQASQSTSRNSKNKSKPLITTKLSESNPEAFESSLLELATIDQPAQQKTPTYFSNHHHRPRRESAEDDCDDTTVSNLTNPTYFQTLDPKSWATMTMEEVAQQHHIPKSPSTPDPKIQKIDEEGPSSPDMGDFFMADKASMDSWEKNDTFSDPFFAKSSNKKKPFPKSSEELFGGASTDDDATALFGKDTAFPTFEDEMKTDDFQTMAKPDGMDTTPSRPPRPAAAQPMSPKVTSPTPEARGRVPTTESPSTKLTRQTLRSMSPSARRKLRSRSPSNVPSVKPLPPTTNVVQQAKAQFESNKKPPAPSSLVSPSSTMKKAPTTVPHKESVTSPAPEEGKASQPGNVRSVRRNRSIRKSMSNRSITRQVSSSSTSKDEEPEVEHKAPNRAAETNNRTSANQQNTYNARKRDQEIEDKLAKAKAVVKKSENRLRSSSRNSRVTSSPARSISASSKQAQKHQVKHKETEDNAVPSKAIASGSHNPRTASAPVRRISANKLPNHQGAQEVEEKAADGGNQNPRTTSSPARRLASSKLPQRYQAKYKKEARTNTADAQEAPKKKNSPALTINESNSDDVSTLHVLATSPTRRTRPKPKPETRVNIGNSSTFSKKKWTSAAHRSTVAASRNSAAALPVATTYPGTRSATVKKTKVGLTSSSESANTVSREVADSGFEAKPTGHTSRISSRAKQAMRFKNRSPPLPSTSQIMNVVTSGDQLLQATTEPKKELPKASNITSERDQRKYNIQSTEHAKQPSHVVLTSDSTSVTSTISGSTGQRQKPTQATTKQQARPKNFQIDTALSISKSSSKGSGSSGDEDSLRAGIFSVGKQQEPSRRLTELRQVLHRPRVHNRGRTPKNTGPMKSVFDFYDEKKVADPVARAGLRLLSGSVVPIQAAVRRFLVGRRLLTQWWAALVIQSRYRAYAQEMRYESQRYCAIQIQRVVRGMLVWQRLCLEDYCATEIQRIVRGHQASMKCYAVIYSVTVVQAHWRRRQAQREANRRYLSLIYIQAWARGTMWRQTLELQHLCATEIQRHVRGHQATMQVYEEIYRITVIQTFVRRKQAVALMDRMRKERDHWASVTIQRYVRGHLAMLFAYEEIYRITVIQNFVRRKQAVALIDRMRKERDHWASVTIQRYVRGHLAMLFAYEEIYKIIAVQSFVRQRQAVAFVNRIKQERKQRACVTIQRHVRGYLAVLYVYEEIYKVMIVQNLVRRRRAIQLASKRMNALILIQSQWRMYQVQSSLMEQTFAAVEIQRIVRGYLSTMVVYEDIYKITVVQNCWRAVKARRQAMVRRRLALLVGTAARGYIARKDYQFKRQKAIIIQSAWRSFYCRLLYQFKLIDIIVLQSLWRRRSASKFVRKKRSDLLHQKRVNAATMIQSQWRSFSAALSYLLFLSNVITVQSVVRRWLDIRRVTAYKTEYSLRLQRMARGFIARSQASARMYLIVSLQSLTRGLLQKRKYLHMRAVRRETGAIAIQKTWRGFVCRADYMFTIADVVIVQSLARKWRATLNVNQLREERQHQLEVKSATMIQAQWKSFSAAMAYLLYLSNVITVQTVARRWFGTRHVTAYKTEYSLRLQRVARGFIARRQASTRMYLIVSLQSRTRGLLQKRKYLHVRAVHREKAAIAIQKIWRGFVCRADYMFTIADVVIVQSMARKWRAILKVTRLREERQHQLEVKSATKIQSQWRSFNATMTYLLYLSNVIIVQSVARRWSGIRQVGAYRTAYATRLQRVARGFLGRTNARRKMKAVVSLQSFIRGFHQQKQYRQLQQQRRENAAIVLQAAWRSFVSRTDYMFAVADIVIVQTLVRRWSAKRYAQRRLEELKLWAAGIIQVRWKLHKSHMAFRLLLQQNKSARIIQAGWRMYWDWSSFMISYQSMVLIQAAVRGFLVRCKFSESIWNVSLLQARARGFLGRQKAAGLKMASHQIRLAAKISEEESSAATALQSRFRSFVARDVYVKYVSARMIQAAHRGHTALIRYRGERQRLREFDSSCCIQSHWRKYKAHVAYLKQRQLFRAATKIQAAWRGFLEYTDYMFIICDLIRFQSLVRCFIQRKRYLKMRADLHCRSATALQTMWRRFHARTVYQETMEEILISQAYVRGWIARKRFGTEVRLKREQEAASALRIQQQWRLKSATSMLKKHRCARSIQNCWRMCRAERELETLLLEYVAAARIQAAWRGFLAFTNYLFTISDIIRVQSLARRRNARREFLALHDAMAQSAATKLQTQWRCFFARKKFVHAKTSEAARKIQLAWRSYKARELLVLMMGEFVAASLIQAAWRGHKTRHKYRMDLAEVIKVQTLIRGFIARRRFKQERCHKSVVVLQSVFRACLTCKQYRRNKTNIVVVQALARRLISKRLKQDLQHNKNIKCAMVLQRNWRRRKCECEYHHTQTDIITVQSIIRRRLAQLKYEAFMSERRDQAAIVLQKTWRGFSAYAAFVVAMCDVIAIQSCVRRLIAKRELNRLRCTRDMNSALSIQKTWRMYFCKTNYDFIITDVIRVQSQARKYIAAKEFAIRRREREHKCATVIQKSWRAFYCMTNYDFVHADVIKAQSQVRSYLAKQEFSKRLQVQRAASACLIQKIWRGYFATLYYELVRSDIIRLQRYWRNVLRKMEREQAELERRNASSITIQRTWRGYLIYTTYAILYSDVVKVQSLARALIARQVCKARRSERQNGAATIIQCTFRGWTERKYTAEKKGSIVTIQRCWRGYKERLGLFIAWEKHVAQINHAATQVQKTWRGYQLQQQHLYTVGSVIQIQSLFRRYLARSLQEQRQLAAIQIQAAQRRLSCRMKVLKHLANLLAHSVRNNPAPPAALTIQCAWRNMRLQKRIHCRMLEMRAIRELAAIRISSFFMMVHGVRVVEKMRVLEAKQEAATTIQLWYRVASRVRNRRRARAGRKILKFLKLVKEEVDRAVRAEVKKRKFRNKMRNRTKEFDDEMLETAWLKVDETEPRRQPSRKSRSTIHRSNSISSDLSFDDDEAYAMMEASVRSSRTYSHSHRRGGDDGSVHGSVHPGDYERSEDPYHFDKYGPPRVTRSGSMRYDEEVLVARHPPPIGRRSNPPLPPPVAVMPRYPNHNDYYVISANDYYDMAPAPSAYRLPPPRMKRFSHQQIEQDLSLEEAYLDMEINEAKERRMADKLMKQQQKRSRSRSRNRSSSSSASVKSSGGSSVRSSSRARSGSHQPSSTRSSSKLRSSSTVRSSSTARSVSHSHSSHVRSSSAVRGGSRSSSSVRGGSSRPRGGGSEYHGSIPRDRDGSRRGSRSHAAPLRMDDRRRGDGM